MDQDEGFDVQLSISHKDGMHFPTQSPKKLVKPTPTLPDPKSNDDFTVLITPASFKEIDRGHTCVHVADPPSSVKIGDKATLQIKYIADFDKPENQTFYACTDITYIDPTKFDPKTAKCFNATEPNESPSSGSDSNEPKPSKGHKGLSGGAIAGVVIGSLAGAGLLAIAAVLLYRRNQQKQRLQRQQHSERAVKWDEQPGRESDSNRSVRLKNLGQAS